MKDVFVVYNIEYSGQPGTQWLSGFSGSSSVLIMTAQHKILLTDGRYTNQAKLEAPAWDIVTIDRGGYIESSVAIIKKLKVQKIAVDSTRTSYDAMLALSAHVAVKAMPQVLQTWRIIKTKREIACIQRAIDTAIRAFEALLPTMRVGMTERQCAARLEYLMKQEGADAIAFDTICVSGIRTALPHGTPSDRKIKKGELITVDFGAVVDGYCSDITRTITLSEPPPKLRKIYEIVREAQELGCNAIKAGVTGRAVDATVRDHIARKGYGKYFLHGTGHGLGMEVHELPYINHSNAMPLDVGAIVTCEPGIYIDGVGGVRIEDDLIVTKTGSRNLTKRLSKELVVVQ